MLKRIILVLVIVGIILSVSSCGDRDVEIMEKPILEGLEFQDSAEVLDVHVVFFENPEEGYLESIAAEFKKLSNIELNISTHITLDLSGVKTVQQMKSTGSSGLYLFSYSNFERITELRESNEILSVEKYLENNFTWNSLPYSMRNMFLLEDGKIWAIPRGFTPVVTGRIFRQDYLTTLELEVPNDLNSLYEVSKKLAESDPDNNGVNDTYGMIYSNASNLKDIFYANGVSVNTSNDTYHQTTISYSIKHGSFEDSMLFDGMEDTLNYIYKMRKEGILKRVGGRRDSGSVYIEENDKIANVYTRIPMGVYNDDRFTIVSGILGSEAAFLNPLTYDIRDGFYVLGANTENPEKMVNTFVSMLFGDLETYLLLSHGVSGETYEVENGGVTILDYSFFERNFSSLAGKNPLYEYENMKLNLDKKLTANIFIEEFLDSVSMQDQYIRTALDSNMMFELLAVKAFPEVFKSEQGMIFNSTTATIFDNRFERILTGRVSVKDSIEGYISDMKKLGMQEIIDNLNKDIGEKTKFRY